MQIFITRGGDSSGPYSIEDVRAYYEQGVFLPDDLAYHDGLPGWTPLKDVLAMASPGLPPVTPVPPSNPQPARAVAAEVPEPAVAPVKSKKALVIAAAVAALVVLGGVGTVVYLKFIKGGEEPQLAQKNAPSKKANTYAQTNTPPITLPSNPEPKGTA